MRLPAAHAGVDKSTCQPILRIKYACKPVRPLSPGFKTLHRRRDRQAASCSQHHEVNHSERSHKAAEAPASPALTPPPLQAQRPSAAAQLQGFACLLAVALLWGSYTPALR